MEAVSPTPVAHSLRLMPSQQQWKHARTGSWKMRACERRGSWTGVVSVELGREMRREQRVLDGGNCSVRTRGQRRRQRRCSSAGKGSASNAAAPGEEDEGKKEQEQEQERSRKLKVGIVGFGNFGQFLAERMVQQGSFEVVAHSRRDYSDRARQLGVAYFRDMDDFCEEHPAVVVVCTSILSSEAVVQALPLHRLERNTLFVDVLSVKQFPKNLFLQTLPVEFDILCTHPMFGPESGKGSWEGLPVVYDKVRISSGKGARCANKVLQMFAKEGCRMVELSCAEHDRCAASSQFITHTVGRILGELELHSTPINTQSYETLLELVQNTSNDSFELYYGLFMYNPNAIEELQRLEEAFDSTKKQLLRQLHSVFKKQLFSKMDSIKGISFSIFRFIIKR